MVVLLLNSTMWNGQGNEAGLVAVGEVVNLCEHLQLIVVDSLYRDRLLADREDSLSLGSALLPLASFQSR